MTVFDDEVIEAIRSYMNSDPMEANLTIVMGHTGDRSFEHADLVTFTATEVTFDARRKAHVERISVPWRHPISERAQVREQLMLLWQESLDGFGSR